MEISKDALMRVIKATRLSMKLAEDTQKLFAEKGITSVADIIAGDLADSIFIISNEHLAQVGDFSDSQTMKILKSDLDEETAAELFEIRSRVYDSVFKGKEEPEQPKPHTFEKTDFTKLYEQFGGYTHCTPEGEWK